LPWRRCRALRRLLPDHRRSDRSNRDQLHVLDLIDQPASG
jgi:hypothetical protein